MVAMSHRFLYVMLPFLLLSLVYYYRFSLLQLKNSILQLWVWDKGQSKPKKWFVLTQQHRFIHITPEPTSVITRYVMIVIFTSEMRAVFKRAGLVLCVGSLSLLQRRRLRLLLTA